jgi:hypothetical protein
MILVATQSTALGESLLNLLAAIAPDRSSERVTTMTAMLDQLTAAPVELIVLDAELLKDALASVLHQIETLAPTLHYLVLAETVEQHADLKRLGVKEVLLNGAPALEIATTIERLLDVG